MQTPDQHVTPQHLYDCVSDSTVEATLRQVLDRTVSKHGGQDDGHAGEWAAIGAALTRLKADWRGPWAANADAADGALAEGAAAVVGDSIEQFRLSFGEADQNQRALGARQLQHIMNLLALSAYHEMLVAVAEYLAAVPYRQRGQAQTRLAKQLGLNPSRLRQMLLTVERLDVPKSDALKAMEAERAQRRAAPHSVYLVHLPEQARYKYGMGRTDILRERLFAMRVPVELRSSVELRNIDEARAVERAVGEEVGDRLAPPDVDLPTRGESECFTDDAEPPALPSVVQQLGYEVLRVDPLPPGWYVNHGVTGRPHPEIRRPDAPDVMTLPGF